MYIKILEDLVGCQSLTPHSAGAIEYISALLEQNGFKTEIKIFGNENYNVTNLYAVYGDSRPNICFAGHVDVVPASDASLWFNDPFTATNIGDKIYGRGVVDMKGAVACFLAASLDFIRLNPIINGAVSFLLTSDEEGEAKYGTAEMLKYLHRNNSNLIDLAIVGEPSNEREVGDTVKIGRRGSINFVLTIYGVPGHVAYPLEANNPITALILILNELNNHVLDAGSEFFQKSNLEITSVDVGNKVINVIPRKISANFNIRFNDLHSLSSLIIWVKQVVEKYRGEHKFEYELSNLLSADCFIQKSVGLVDDFVQLVTDTTKIDTKLSTSGGTSDARFIKNYCPVVEFGLKSETAHKINEYTEIIDLQKLYYVYYQSLIRFLI